MLPQAKLVSTKANTGYKLWSTHLRGDINTFLGWDHVVSPSNQIAVINNAICNTFTPQIKGIPEDT